MDGVAKILVIGAMVAFVMAILTVFTGDIIAPPESWSRAANNLALIAIALFIGFKDHGGHAKAPSAE